jgi:ComF family protein
MLHIITLLIDSLFPPRPQEVVVRAITTRSVTDLYRPGTHLHIEYLSNYQNPRVHALITENKYNGNRHAACLLGQLLPLHLKQVAHHVLIPIPLHSRRERERGYNQVTVVLKESGYPVAQKLITRKKYTPSQTTLKKSERLANLHGAFSVDIARLATYEHTHFILVDDVITTGATMAAARAVLQPHLHPTSTLTCLALAH